MPDHPVGRCPLAGTTKHPYFRVLATNLRLDKVFTATFLVKAEKVVSRLSLSSQPARALPRALVDRRY